MVIKSYSLGHIDASITSPGGLRWRFTGFYGNPRGANRRFSWELLQKPSGISDEPWVYGGDFNEILALSEKMGGNDRTPFILKN